MPVLTEIIKNKFLQARTGAPQASDNQLQISSRIILEKDLVKHCEKNSLVTKVVNVFL